MKARLPLSAIIIALLLLIGSVAAGCSSDDDNVNGSGDPLTLDAWFDQVEALSQAYADDLEALDTQAGKDFDKADSDNESIEVWVNFIEDKRSTTADFAGDLDGLRAFDEAAAAQSETVTAGQELVSLYGDALKIVDLSGTFDDATLVLEGPGILDALDRFGDACVALQGIADSNDIDVDLRCPS